jgi:predicted nucleotidyltransferase
MAGKQTTDRCVQPYRYASPNIPVAAIRRFACQIAERFQPEKIVLFGSYAYGEPHEESDVDLLVVMPTRNAIDQSIRITSAFEWPFMLDLIVRTPWQLERGLKDDDWFLREITEKGRTLYEAADRAVGAQSRRGLGSGVRARRRHPAASRRRVLSLPASRGKISQGASPGSCTGELRMQTRGSLKLKGTK